VSRRRRLGHAIALVLQLALPVVLTLWARPATSAEGTCDVYSDRPVFTGRTPRALDELSGMVASRRHPGIYWAHNDSGHELRLFAIRETGAVVATFAVRGVQSRDPEDVAIGPCAPKDRRSCIYLADTGDNLRSRTRVQIIRVLEPERLRSGVLVGDAFPFTYPDGAYDTEALLIDPRTAEAIVITKSIMSLGQAFRLELGRDARPIHAIPLGALAAPPSFDAFTTSASVHPTGSRILLRTYRTVWEFRRPGAARLADVLRSAPIEVPGGNTHLQGEAVTYTADGRAYVLAGEGADTAIVRFDCRR
jgi:hypothetical protein